MTRPRFRRFLIVMYVVFIALGLVDLWTHEKWDVIGWPVILVWFSYRLGELSKGGS